MLKYLEYEGKLILNYESRSEQLAICKLYDILHVATIEDVVMILDGYDAKREAENDPKWSAAREPMSKG